MFHKLQLSMSFMFYVLKCELRCIPNKFSLTLLCKYKYILCRLLLKYDGFRNVEQAFVSLFKNKILKNLIFEI